MQGLRDHQSAACGARFRTLKEGHFKSLEGTFRVQADFSPILSKKKANLLADPLYYSNLTSQWTSSGGRYTGLYPLSMLDLKCSAKEG